MYARSVPYRHPSPGISSGRYRTRYLPMPILRHGCLTGTFVRLTTGLDARSIAHLWVGVVLAGELPSVCATGRRKNLAGEFPIPRRLMPEYLRGVSGHRE